MSDTAPRPRWYTVHTKARQEEVARDNLERQHYTSYLPLVVMRKRRRDRWVDVVEPLFPRYLFVRFDPDTTNIAPIRSTLGVTGLVRFGNELVPVPDDVIAWLRQAENPATGHHDPNRPQFEPGEKVEILEGPFAGLQGIYQVQKGEERVLILITLLGRQNAVPVKLDHVGKL